MKELVLHDAAIGLCFWSVVLLVFMQFFELPHSLAKVLSLFLVAVIIVCLPFSLYRIGTALYLAKEGVEVTASILSCEASFLGRKAKFEYEYDGGTYQNTKYFLSVFFPEEDRLKLLVDPGKPSGCVILEFKKKSIIAIVRERDS